MLNILENPENTRVVGWLSRNADRGVALVASDAFPDSKWPYLACGCHPEIVERIWDQIGSALPQSARYVLWGRPVLVDPATGLVLAVGYGTSYVLRVPGGVTAGEFSSSHRWNDGTTTDLSQELGEGWVFGAWVNDETNWLQAGFAYSKSRRSK